MLSQSLAGQRVVASLIASFAALALVMSTTGVFTLVSYLTSRRVKEIALRRAIGARDSDVFWLLAGQTFVWTLIGLATGVAGSAMASRALRAAVVGVTQLDTTMVAVIAGVYLAIVAVAMALPALKALRIDPIAALRQD
jgi:ABC-type antimicrobial peptide transport system permease subunit